MHFRFEWHVHRTQQTSPMLLAAYAAIADFLISFRTVVRICFIRFSFGWHFGGKMEMNGWMGREWKRVRADGPGHLSVAENSRKAYEISAMHTFSHSIFAIENFCIFILTGNTVHMCVFVVEYLSIFLLRVLCTLLLLLLLLLLLVVMVAVVFFFAISIVHSFFFYILYFDFCVRFLDVCIAYRSMFARGTILKGTMEPFPRTHVDTHKRALAIDGIIRDCV